MNVDIGMVMKVIRGIPSTERAAWLGTGDVVKVVAVYPHVVLVERPYKANRDEKMRECFQRRNLHMNLRRVM